MFRVHPHHGQDNDFSEIVETSAESYYGQGYQDITTRKPNIEKAQRLLGWTPRIGLEDSLRMTIYAFLEENEDAPKSADRREYSRPENRCRYV
jgi:UDP-4-amino-4-deoxy-L-arabinose formyltransferase/UDP-glucuronic acid dehydrogenase (UDP-4-keto-hexauronic acid decarboxylating)